MINRAGLMELIRSKQAFTYRGVTPSLREIARQTDVSPSTFTRIQNGHDLNAEAFVRILNWLNKAGYSWTAIISKVIKETK